MRRDTSFRSPLGGADLTRILVDSFEKGGAVAEHNPAFAPDEAANPRVILASPSDEPWVEYRISVWPLQPGVGPRGENVRRLRIEPPFDTRIREYSAQTLLLGYEPGMRLFAGFDPLKHFRYGFRPGPRTIAVFDHATAFIAQETAEVPESLLAEAENQGFWVEKTKRGRLVVALWPEMLPLYGMYAADLFKYASSEKTLRALQDALRSKGLPIPSVDHLRVGERAFVLRLHKDKTNSKFRASVMRAYDSTCALSGMQLSLLEAAHILPAKDSKSTNEVSNGIVLQPTLHRAMDRGVIYPKMLGPGDYKFCLNRERANLLAPAMGVGGLDWIESIVGKRISADRLPKNPDEQPSWNMIREAYRYNRIRIELIG